MMKTMCKVGCVAVLSLAAAVAVAQEAAENEPSVVGGQVYKTVDASGKVIFTDKPPASGATEAVRMPSVNTIPATPAASGDGTEGGQQEQAAQEYTRFEISSPVDEEVLGQEVESVTLSATLEPDLQDGHRVELLYDGQIVATELSYTVELLERGTHTVEAKVYDQKGQLLKQAPMIQFHVRRISLLNKSSANDKPGQPQPQLAGGLMGRLLGLGSSRTPVAQIEPTGGYGGPKGAGSLGGAGNAAGAGSPGGAAAGRDARPAGDIAGSGRTITVR